MVTHVQRCLPISSFSTEKPDGLEYLVYNKTCTQWSLVVAETSLVQRLAVH